MKLTIEGSRTEQLECLLEEIISWGRKSESPDGKVTGDLPKAAVKLIVLMAYAIGGGKLDTDVPDDVASLMDAVE